MNIYFVNKASGFVCVCVFIRPAHCINGIPFIRLSTIKCIFSHKHVCQYGGVVREKKGSVSKRNPMPSLMVWFRCLIHVLCANLFCTMGLVQVLVLYITYTSQAPHNTCHPHTHIYTSCVYTVHMQMFPANNMCIISCRTEREGCCHHCPSGASRCPSGDSWTDTRRYHTCSLNTYGHTHTPFTVDKGTCWGVVRCFMVIDLSINIELVDFSVNLTSGLLFEVCAVNISQ